MHKIKPRGNPEPAPGTRNLAPAKYLLNENPSLVALGKNSRRKGRREGGERERDREREIERERERKALPKHIRSDAPTTQHHLFAVSPKKKQGRRSALLLAHAVVWVR